MKKNKTKEKNKVKIGNIILNTICVLIFAFAAYELILKFTNNSIYLFGVRNDVVLTNSMSYKNEDPRIQSFLEGHDDQLQVGDLVQSTKVKKDTELKVYDIVLFINKDNNKLTIHRIVEIKDGSSYMDGQDRYLIRADTANIGSHDGVYTHDEIIAKYKSRIPIVGHIHNFLTSIFGIIIEVGIIVIIVLYQYFDDKYFKKEENESGKMVVEELTTNDQNIDKEITEQPKEDNTDLLEEPNNLSEPPSEANENESEVEKPLQEEPISEKAIADIPLKENQEIEPSTEVDKETVEEQNAEAMEDLSENSKNQTSTEENDNQEEVKKD